MEKIVEKFLSDEKAREEKTLKTAALANMEAGVPWNGD